jgi:hypothetical protein
MMNRKEFTAVASLVFVVIFVFGGAQLTQAQDNKTPYPSMAPLVQYLMAHDAEIALARSAAPHAISRDAKILVLGPHGYETAVEGKNGFVCDVERSWMSPSPDDPEFWNFKQRAATCYNPQAARFILPFVFMKTELVLAGLSKAQIYNRLETAYAKKELPSLEPGAMCYMMSKQAYLTDDGNHDRAHLMFYAPPMGAGNWGANVANSPVSMDEQPKGNPSMDVLVVPVGKWSDGTPAPLM